MSWDPFIEDEYSRAYEEGFKDGVKQGLDNADIEWKQQILESDDEGRARETKLMEAILSLLSEQEDGFYRVKDFVWWESIKQQIRDLPNKL